MEIIKSKRKCKCLNCLKPIHHRYKVRINKGNYHLSCVSKWLKKRLDKTKMELKQFSKQKYKKQMILERLE